MFLGVTFERFLQNAPLSVMFRALLERTIDPREIERLFEQTTTRQYTREIFFSSIVKLMGSVVCGVHPSIRAAYISALWLTSSLALLASLLVAPIRTSGFVSVSSRPECLRRNFALPPGQPATRLSAAMVTDAVLQVNARPSEKALRSEFEEQDRADPLDPPRVSFLIPCSFGKVLDRQLIAPRSILALYPLRC